MKWKLQLLFCILAGSYLITKMTSSNSPVLCFITIFVVLLLVIIALFKGIKLISKKSSYEDIGEFERSINKLTIDDAKALAIPIINNPDKFIAIIDQDRLWSSKFILHPSIVDLFTHYSEIKAIRGDARLSRQGICISDFNRDYIVIGTDIDFTQIVVKPSSEIVYEIDGSEKTEKDIKKYDSVYHWLLIIDRILE